MAAFYRPDGRLALARPRSIVGGNDRPHLWAIVGLVSVGVLARLVAAAGLSRISDGVADASHGRLDGFVPLDHAPRRSKHRTCYCGVAGKASEGGL